MEEAFDLLSRVQVLVSSQKDLATEARIQALHELKVERAELEKEKQALVLEKRSAHVQTTGHNERVKLNVGGVMYETTLSTLRKEESFLSALFCGRYEVMRDQGGSVFIDRDGAVFRHVLNYLRRGRLLIEEDDTLAKELLDEARFFQISSLVELLQPSKVVLPFGDHGNGLFHWLGTCGSTREWTNPVLLGNVRVRSSRAMSGTPEGVVGKNQVAGGICKVRTEKESLFLFVLTQGKDGRGQWVELDIGKDRLFCVSHYSLRPGQCCRMGNWSLQASLDREEWVTLSAHNDEFWEGQLKVCRRTDSFVH
jgi:hypothetical protein